MQISRRRLYQTASCLFVPVSVYNLYVAFSHMDVLYEQVYLRSLIGGLSLLVLSIVFLVISIRQPDRMISVCERTT